MDSHLPNPNCPCGFIRCDPVGDPYCEVTRLAKRAVASSKAEGGPGLSESDALLAAFDEMARFHREEAARRVATPEATSSVRVPSKKTLKERASEREGRAISPSWLLENDPAVDAIIASED